MRTWFEIASGTPCSAMTAGRFAVAIGQWAVVLDDALERFPCQVETVEGRIAPLKTRDHAQRLRVVIEAAMRGEAAIERALPGVAERRMAEIMRQRQRLGEILVEAELAGDGAGDLRHLQRMGQPRPVVVALVINEDLRLVLEAAERGGMDNAVAIAPEIAAIPARRLITDPPRLRSGSQAKEPVAVSVRQPSDSGPKGGIEGFDSGGRRT